jgi:hypothetical protein
MKTRLALLFTALLVASVAITSACSSDKSGDGGSVSISGTVTKSDVGAKTFSIKGKDGKDYDFRMVSGSKGDINEIKEHQDRRKEIEVKFKPGSNPFEVVFAD